jgi:hypothetical protein
MFIGSDGNVGIGTTSPAHLLSVNGIADITTLEIGGIDATSAWTAFTPSWTNLTVGAGTNTGAYKQIGKTVFFRVRFTLAADSSVTGAITLSLPVAKEAYTAILGSAEFYDSGTATYTGVINEVGAVRVNKTDGTYEANVATSSTVPFTWTTGDGLFIQGFYEAD